MEYGITILSTNDKGRKSMIQQIDYDNYWSTADIMSNLSVSKDWIYQNIRPNMDVKKLEEVGEEPEVLKARNTVWYRKDVLFALFIKNIKVYTRDYPNTTERLRGEEIEIPMPDEIKEKILTGEFEFINIKKFQETTKFNSTESAYRMLYRLRAYSVKLFGKTYYYIP